MRDLFGGIPSTLASSSRHSPSEDEKGKGGRVGGGEDRETEGEGERGVEREESIKEREESREQRGERREGRGERERGRREREINRNVDLFQAHRFKSSLVEREAIL